MVGSGEWSWKQLKGCGKGKIQRVGMRAANKFFFFFLRHIWYGEKIESQGPFITGCGGWSRGRLLVLWPGWWCHQTGCRKKNRFRVGRKFRKSCTELTLDIPSDMAEEGKGMSPRWHSRWQQATREAALWVRELGKGRESRRWGSGSPGSPQRSRREQWRKEEHWKSYLC